MASAKPRRAKAAAQKSAAPAVAQRLSLTVQYACQDRELPPRSKLRRWVGAACAGSAQITLRFVAAEEGRELNRAWRGKDHATNVLSFPYEVAPVTLGDLVVCVPVVLKEAQAQGKPAAAHFAHLVVHGMLHLQGYDHETGAADAARMEKKEIEILARLGFPDPY